MCRSRFSLYESRTPVVPTRGEKMPTTSSMPVRTARPYLERTETQQAPSKRIRRTKNMMILVVEAGNAVNCRQAGFSGLRAATHDIVT